VEPVAVDHARREDADDDSRRAADDGVEELRPSLVRELLRVVELGERTDAVVAQVRVVEQHPGDDERPGE